MLRHKNLTNAVLIVSNDISSNGKIKLNNDGHVVTPLTPEAEIILLTNPDFVREEGEVSISHSADTDIAGLTVRDDEKLKELTADYDDLKTDYEQLLKDFNELKNVNEKLNEELINFKIDSTDKQLDGDMDSSKPDETVQATQENTGETAPQEGDTKIENGKGFIYKKNSASKLTWLRHSEIDE
jgi:regulator of replication initiation timing